MVNREFNRQLLLALTGIYLYVMYSTDLPMPWFYPVMGLAVWFIYDLGLFARKTARRQHS